MDSRTSQNWVLLQMKEIAIISPLIQIYFLNFAEVLEFSNNLLSDEIAPSLIRILNLNQVVHLDLTNNAFTPGGAEVLAKFLLATDSKCKLNRLLLSLNNLRSEGCMHLCEVCGHD